MWRREKQQITQYIKSDDANLFTRKITLFAWLAQVSKGWWWMLALECVANFCTIMICTGKGISAQIITRKLCTIWANHLRKRNLKQKGNGTNKINSKGTWKKVFKQKFRTARDLQLTILSAPMCWPTHGLHTNSGHEGHGEPGAGSSGWNAFFFFGFNVNSGFGGGLGPWHLNEVKERR